jgi:sulfhydrogenase subunit delta
MTTATTNGRPTVGVFGLSGCSGDQLVVLNCEDQLLELASLLDLRDFTTAASDPDRDTPLDVAFVEGAVTSARDEQVVRRVRERATCLIALGTCAVWGGVIALDRLHDRGALVRDIYGDLGAGFDTMPARAVHEVVPVDYSITGCPIEKDEFLSAVSQILQGFPPLPQVNPVCAECRMQEHGCLLLDRGLPCCGPVTLGGCHARCPALGVACIGCRGPAPDINVEGTVAAFVAHGIPAEEARRRLAVFAPLHEPVPAEVA